MTLKLEGVLLSALLCIFLLLSLSLITMMQQSIYKERERERSSGPETEKKENMTAQQLS